MFPTTGGREACIDLQPLHGYALCRKCLAPAWFDIRGRSLSNRFHRSTPSKCSDLSSEFSSCTGHQLAFVGSPALERHLCAHSRLTPATLAISELGHSGWSSRRRSIVLDVSPRLAKPLLFSMSLSYQESPTCQPLVGDLGATSFLSCSLSASSLRVAIISTIGPASRSFKDLPPVSYRFTDQAPHAVARGVLDERSP